MAEIRRSAETYRSFRDGFCSAERGFSAKSNGGAAYPPAACQRLAAIKRRYDPGSVFRRNHSIHPGS